MPTNRHVDHNPILGIDFAHDEVRVVEVRRESGSMTVTAAGTAPIPAGSLEPGSTTPPEIVGQRLRNLLRKIGAETRNAVVGIPSSGVFTRLLDVPQMGDAELAPVVAGEVTHYQMIRPGSGAFDFIKLPTPEGAREAQVLVMASDDPVLIALGQIARSAGIVMEYREPSPLASIRAAIPHGSFNDPTLVISVQDHATEIAVIEPGRLGLYRRIDVGGRHLIANSLQVAHAQGGGTPEGLLPVDDVLSARLATEVRRSLDYYRRQYPTLDVGRAVLVVTDARLEGLASFLGASLGVDCAVAETWAVAGGTASNELRMPSPSAFMGAIGLAMGAHGHATNLLPRFDLVPAAPRTRAQRIGGDSSILYSAAATIAIGIIGFVTWNSIKGQADSIERTNVGLKTEGVRLSKELAPLQTRRDEELRVLAQLANQGVPFPWIMDEVAGALDPEVGVSEITFDGGRIRLIADSKNEAAMITTLDRLRMNDHFSAAFVDSFQNPDNRGLTFNLSSGFQVRVPELNPTAIEPQTAGGSNVP